MLPFRLLNKETFVIRVVRVVIGNRDRHFSLLARIALMFGRCWIGRCQLSRRGVPTTVCLAWAIKRAAKCASAGTDDLKIVIIVRSIAIAMFALAPGLFGGNVSLEHSYGLTVLDVVVPV